MPGHLQLENGHLAKTSTAHLSKCAGTCCDNVTSVTVTLTGWGGCFGHMNGTYVLSDNGDCTWSLAESDAGPASPCDALDPDLCQTTTQGPLTYYWYNLAKSRSIIATLDNAGATPSISVRVECLIWVYKLSGASCTDGGANRGEINDFGRNTCDSGAASFLSLAYRDVTGGLTNYTVGSVAVAV
jgi:hypothetical protein